MPKEFAKFVISQKGMIMRDGKCLIVKLPREDYDEKWDLPGGRIDVGEEGMENEAFKREMAEETGLLNFIDLGPIEYHTHIPSNDKFPPFCGIIRLVENKSDEIRLSAEHIEMHWISEEEVDDYEYIWTSWMGKIMKKGFEIYKKNKII